MFVFVSSQPVGHVFGEIIDFPLRIHSSSKIQRSKRICSLSISVDDELLSKNIHVSSRNYDKRKSNSEVTAFLRRLLQFYA